MNTHICEYSLVLIIISQYTLVCMENYFFDNVITLHGIHQTDVADLSQQKIFFIVDQCYQ